MKFPSAQQWARVHLGTSLTCLFPQGRPPASRVCSGIVRDSFERGAQIIPSPYQQVSSVMKLVWGYNVSELRALTWFSNQAWFGANLCSSRPLFSAKRGPVNFLLIFSKPPPPGAPEGEERGHTRQDRAVEGARLRALLGLIPDSSH